MAPRRHQALRCACQVMFDPFAGVGGNVVQFANTCQMVRAGSRAECPALHLPPCGLAAHHDPAMAQLLSPGAHCHSPCPSRPRARCLAVSRSCHEIQTRSKEVRAANLPLSGDSAVSEPSKPKMSGLLVIPVCVYSRCGGGGARRWWLGSSRRSGRTSSATTCCCWGRRRACVCCAPTSGTPSARSRCVPLVFC